MNVKNSHFSVINFFSSSLFFLILAITSCTDQGEPKGPASNGYYPLVQGSKWVYVKQYLSEDNTPIAFDTDTIIYRVKEDTTVDGIKYSTIYDKHNLLRLLVRKDNTKYYGRNMDLYTGFNTEYLVFDENLKVGSTWTHIKSEGYQKTEYSIKSKSKETLINNVQYKDIVEVSIDHFVMVDEVYKKTSSVRKIYAKDIGEVYANYDMEDVFIPKYDLNLIEYSIE